MPEERRPRSGSFRPREKFVPRLPRRGDGCRGGAFTLAAVDDIYTLGSTAPRRRSAGIGGNGARTFARSHGQDISSCTAALSSTTRRRGDLIADLVRPGGSARWHVAAAGGIRSSPPSQTRPLILQKGQEGEELDIRLELRLLADVGLIGLPNAGKSTFLAAVSNAKPKIANYPFTTLEPMLGVVNVAYDRFTLADLPGLVEGASEGYGLGFEFLKHIRRCRVLLHLVDSTSPDPVTDYELIEGELKAYDPKLEQVARVVAISKADLDEAQARASADALEAHIGRPVRVISADYEIGSEALVAGELLVTEEKTRSSPLGIRIPVLRPTRPNASPSTNTAHRSVIECTRVSFVQMMDTHMVGAYYEILRRLERGHRQIPPREASNAATHRLGDPHSLGRLGRGHLIDLGRSRSNEAAREFLFVWTD